MGKDSLAREDRHQREIWALALLLLSILLALSFVPPTLIGEPGVRLFPTGNIVGEIGGMVSRGAWGIFGIAAFLIPALPAIWAASVLERVEGRATLRLTLLIAGVLVLVPTGIFAFSRPFTVVPQSAGWIGAAIGEPLVAALGWVGAGLLVSFVLAGLCVGTLGWNPFRSMVRSAGVALSSSRNAAAAVGDAVVRYRAGRGAPSEEVPGGETVLRDDEIGTGFVEEETILNGGAATAVAALSRLRSPTTRAKPTAPGGHALEDTGDPTSPDLPATALLTSPPPRDDAKNRRHLDGLGQVLIEKLATFKIDGEIVGTTSGPVVTQFEVEPAPGVKVAQIANLEADLALAMRAPSVRIVAPIPGKGAVGVEVPNPEPEIVYFREVLESPAFRTSKATLPLALGKDISGKPYVADLARMPHLLIAGATGSGKSVCINTIITSLVFKYSPRVLRLLMVDPKMVELSFYNDLPHLRHPVVTDNGEAAGVLKWAVLEMEWRYALLSANNVRNLQDFNRRVEEGMMMRAPEPVGEEGDPERWVYKGGALPYIVLIIDELADLMMTVQGEVEKPLALLAQKARA
ncbi:MAG TPA: DNA translocase FtsK 4TM domain-containing protein, partial [Longimicrobiaceae bacterium]|nr:DNA translocase FtsK 4TM domain-containing protein [Longimicrobiaceae bacterium]